MEWFTHSEFKWGEAVIPSGTFSGSGVAEQ